MTLGDAANTNVAEFSSSGKPISVEVNGHVTEWSVFPDWTQAVQAAKENSRNAAGYCDLRTDETTGIAFCPVLQMKRLISLDEEQFCELIGRHTWFAQIDTIWGTTLSSLVYYGEGNRIKGHADSNGALVWELVNPPAKSHVQSTPRKSSTKRDSQKLGQATGATDMQKMVGSKTNESGAPIWGQIFVQGDNQLGMASYHFVDEATSYISYQSAPANWSMDDGTKYPKMKPFSNPTYDAGTRTFRGTVNWAPQTARKAQVWKYKMIFNEQHTLINEGKISMFASAEDKKPIAKMVFGKDITYSRWEEQAEHAKTGIKKKMEFSKETNDIIRILDMTLTNYENSTKGVRPTPQKTLQLVFGDAVRTWHRDLEADSRVVNQNRR